MFLSHENVLKKVSKMTPPSFLWGHFRHSEFLEIVGSPLDTQNKHWLGHLVEFLNGAIHLKLVLE